MQILKPRDTAPRLTPLHIRSLASNHSTIRRVFGKPQAPGHKDEEDFYNYYLSFQDSRRDLTLQPWILQLSSVNKSNDNALDVLDNPNSSLEEAARALECFVLNHQREAASSLSELKGSFERATPGQRALLWLLIPVQSVISPI